MKYERPAYLDKNIKTEKRLIPYGSTEVEIPKFDTPISSRENFKRAARRDNPVWVPNSLTDVQSLGAQDVITNKVRGMQIHTDFRVKATGDYLFKDWFGTDWTWVQSAGGAMLTPGTILMEDVTEWEKIVKFPDLSEWDFKETAAEYMKNVYNPDKIMHYDIGRGLTERLVSLMGGYTEGMIAMALEPEAVRDLFERYADFVIELFDHVNSLYPLDMVTLHDDWGTERDTFFSEKMMEELVFEPTKRIVDHIKSKDIIFEMHSCGNVTRFVPYMIDFGADILQIQRRAVDIPELKRKYGDKIGFMGGIEGTEFGRKYSDEEMAGFIRTMVDTYGKGGGFYATMFAPDPERLWKNLAELYAYSREFYDAEREQKGV